MSEIKISEMIRELRTDRDISQETLADVCGVSMQAVSKWENGQSCPDISLLPLLAEYFSVSTDYLLTGQNHAAPNPDSDIASSLSEQRLNDNVLYIVQYRNGKILDRQRWNAAQPENRDATIRIQFDEAFSHIKSEFHMEVWGNASIETPDVKMSLTAGGNASCNGSIQGSVSAGASVNCDVVRGDVSAGNSVKCSTVEGDVSAGYSVSCDTVQGNASAGSYISCNRIEGDAEANSIERKNR